MGASVLQDLVVVMVVAAATTLLFHRLKQPVVLGYILAGAAIGPYAPWNLVADTTSINGLAELGLVFLLFALGLEFNLRKLRRVGAPAVLAAFVEITLMLAIGYATGRAFGWSEMDSIFAGAILSISSTTIIVKVLMEMGKVSEDYAEVTFGILIVEDLLAVALVAFLGGFAGSGFDVGAVATVLGQLALYVLITLAVGLVIVPRLIEWVARHRHDELLVITVVGLVFVSALLAINLGLSLALGAFLMGALIAESRAVRRVEHKIIPIRDLFTAVFFVTVGMLLDVSVLREYWLPVVALTLVAVAGKVVAGTVGVLAGGYPGRVALRSGLTLGQIGEFSFIIAALGLALGTMSAFLYPVAVAVCVLTTVLTPFLIRHSDRVADGAARLVPAPIAEGWARWSGHVAHRRTERAERRSDGAFGAARPLVYAAWLLGLLIAAAYASIWVGRSASGTMSLGENVARSGAFTLLGFLALPLFASFEISMEKWLLGKARARNLEPGQLARPIPAYRRPKVVARTLAIVASAGLLGLAIRIAWGVHPLLVPDPVFLLPLLGLVAVTSAVAWPSLVRMYHELDRTLDVLLGRAEEVAPFARLEERYPWGMVTEMIQVSPAAEACYGSLSNLAIDGTGAKVLGIQRGGRPLVSPHRELILLPNDRIFLIGRTEHVREAARVLSRAPEPEPGADGAKIETATLEFQVPPGSPAVGASLDQLALDRAGVRVLSYNRLSKPVVPVDPLLPLRVGDRLVLRGQPTALERVRSTLKLRGALGANN